MKKNLISTHKLSSLALLSLVIISCEKEVENNENLADKIDGAGSFEEAEKSYSESE
jgi:hypothetical protein